MVYSNAISTYRETKVKTASQGQLVIMLYEEAVRCLDRALQLLVLNDEGKKNPRTIESISKSILKTQEIITELAVSLNFDEGGEIATNLFALYTWFNKELLEANINQDVRKVTIIRNQINELRSAWVEIAGKNTSDSTDKSAPGLNIAG